MPSNSTNSDNELEWNADKMLRIYLHDYFLKRGFHHTAQTFKDEVRDFAIKDSVDIDTPVGFLHEWWGVVYDVYKYRTVKYRKTVPESSTKKTYSARNSNCFPMNPQIPMSQPRHLPYQFQADSSFSRIPPQPAGGPIPSTLYNGEQVYPAVNAEMMDPFKACNIKFGPWDSSDHGLVNSGNQTHNQMVKDSGIGMHLEKDVPRGPLQLVQLKTNEAYKYSSQYLETSSPQTESSNNNKMTYQVIKTVENQNQQDKKLQMQSQKVKKSGRRKKTASLQSGQSSQDSVGAAEGKLLDENVDSFLSLESEHADHRILPFSNLERISTLYGRKEYKDFSFKQVGSLHSSKSKVLSSHFSPDGKILASAGHEKKVFIWNMKTFESAATQEEHSLLITDVRFRAGSTIFATSSFDKSIRLWDAAFPTRSILKLDGHADQVMSLDFHPRNVDLLCSSDSSDLIRLWNVNEGACVFIAKGGSKQVRFQPHCGKFLATATGNDVKIVDVEAESIVRNLKGHVKDVLSICWDRSGKYIASVSEDSACIWSSYGECIHKLHSTGNKFQSCIFHPAYLNLLVIGGYQTLEMWSPADGNKTWAVAAHRGLIVGLADSPCDEFIASASHDGCVKLWK